MQSFETNDILNFNTTKQKVKKETYNYANYKIQRFSLGAVQWVIVVAGGQLA